MVALRQTPPVEQQSCLDDSYLRGLEPTVETHERRKEFEPNGMTLACREDEAEIVAYRRIGDEWYPYTGVMWRRWNGNQPMTGFVFKREVQP